MRRWNGWGDEAQTYPLPVTAQAYLEQVIGRGCTSPDAELESSLQSVPPSRLPSHPLVETGQETRLLHACGQSLPDWVALRSGRIPAFPDGVAYPSSPDEVRELLGFACSTGVQLIPYGGGTSVVGHIDPLPGDTPTLTVDVSRMDRLLGLDETSRLATFEAGVTGPALETQLYRRGFTLGHFPQSFEQSTLGGWIATRSSGQQSFHYGRIEALFAGGLIETPTGPLELPPHAASAAGPDLRQIVLGSEGRLGILTRATLRIRPVPEIDRFYGVFFRDWLAGLQAVRAVAQAGIRVSMLRLSDAQETETTLVLSGKDRLVSLAKRGLSAFRYGPERCLLIYGITGSQASATSADRQARTLLHQHGGLFTGAVIGRTWERSRFRTPYLRNTLWELGIATDTLETAVPWSAVPDTAEAVKAALRTALIERGVPEKEARVLVFAHLSHIYADGASIYVTYLFQRAAEPEVTLQRWQALKSAASQVVVQNGGTISHQHGVGRDHAPYLEAEKGQVGMSILAAVCRQVDPLGLMNPGKLFLDPSGEQERGSHVGNRLA